MNLQVEISAPEEEVPITLRTPIFRIVQEGLSNVVKHSDATEVFVSLSSNEKGIFLEIADNGCGFEVAAAAGGNGLGNMRNRLANLGGECQISSSKATGTIVRLIIPLPANTASNEDTSRDGWQPEATFR